MHAQLSNLNNKVTMSRDLEELVPVSKHYETSLLNCSFW